MNEQLESLKQYVDENRASGVSDPVIRQELFGKGWKVSDIDTVLGQDPSITASKGTGWMENARVMHIILGLGAIFFIAGIISCTPVAYNDRIQFPAFLIADVFNIITAFAIWKKTFTLSRSLSHRIYIGILLIPATIFAIGSTLYFANATVEIVGIHLIKDDIVLLVSFVVFLFGLPVQIAVYLLSSINVWILYLRRKKCGEATPSKAVMRGHIYFLVLSIIATAAMFLVILGQQLW